MTQQNNPMIQMWVMTHRLGITDLGHHIYSIEYLLSPLKPQRSLTVYLFH